MLHGHRRISMPLPPTRQDTDQLVVLANISWDHYESMLAMIGDDHPGVRLTYLDGVLEIMSPSWQHEHVKTLIARLVEVWAEEHDLTFIGIGSTTQRSEPKKSGAEPDESYFIGGVKERPDLAIEVVYTSGGVDKLDVYQRLGVREVWFWVEDRLHIFELVDDGYEERERSVVLPDLDLGRIAAIVASTPLEQQTQAVRQFRRSLQ